MSRRAVCEKHKHGSVRGALRNGGAYSTGGPGGEVGWGVRREMAGFERMGTLMHTINGRRMRW